jgi:glutaredoxin 3
MSRVVMYTKDVCPFCERAKALLRSKGVEWEELNIEERPQLRGQMIEMSGRRTVPQIWIGDTHVGGCDELVALERCGQLDPMLGEA